MLNGLNSISQNIFLSLLFDPQNLGVPIMKLVRGPRLYVFPAVSSVKLSQESSNRSKIDKMDKPDWCLDLKSQRLFIYFKCKPSSH